MGAGFPTPDPLSNSMVNMKDPFLRTRVNSLSHSRSTPDLSEITGGAKRARRVERSNSKRKLGRTRADAYLDSSSPPADGQGQTSPNRKSGSVSFSPKHGSGSSLTSRILAGTGINRAISSFNRKSEKDVVENRSRGGTRTLK